MNPDDLLALADSLASSPGATESALRRAISTAYYAVFHLLTTAGAKLLSTDSGRRATLGRKYEHVGMKEISAKLIASQPDQIYTPFLGQPVSAELALVAARFIQLQQARQRADYNVTPGLAVTVTEAVEFVEKARETIQKWRIVEGTDQANAYLLAMLFHPFKKRD